MRLEAGKRYVARNGTITSHLSQDLSEKVFPFSGSIDGDERIWQASGKWGYPSDSRASGYDLVTEYVVTAPADPVPYPARGFPIAEINDERTRQDAKWGEQNHDFANWLAILLEEVGEAAMAANDFKTAKDAVTKAYQGKCYRDELIQVAAVALAMVESYDRNEGKA